MQEYYSQYIEEYYEEDEPAEGETIPVKKVDDDRIHLDSVDAVLQLLEQEKAQDIVITDLTETHSSPYHHMIVCSPLNPRHGKALSEKIRQSVKVTIDEDSVNRHQMDGSQRSGWHCVSVGGIQIHVMTPEARKRFDIEGLWNENAEVSEEEESWTDDANVIPPPRSNARN